MHNNIAICRQLNSLGKISTKGNKPRNELPGGSSFLGLKYSSYMQTIAYLSFSVFPEHTSVLYIHDIVSAGLTILLIASFLAGSPLIV